jgi:hypothetical protein
MYVPSLIHDASVPDMIERYEPQSLWSEGQEKRGDVVNESVPSDTE